MNWFRKTFSSKKSFSELVETIGIFLLMGVGIYFIFIIGESLLYNSKSCWIIFLVCPLIAYSVRRGLAVIVYLIFFLTLFCVVAIFGSNGKHTTYAESILIKGKQEHHKNFIPEGDDGEGNHYPEHYETEYTFTADTSSKIYLPLLENIIEFFPLLNLGFVYLILRKRLFKY